MKDKFLFYTTMIFFLFLNFGCNPNNAISHKKTQTFSLASILKDEHLTAPDKAERLALASETMLVAEAYVEANEIVQQALALDSKNIRAGFIASMLRPILLLKGILARLKPLAEKSDNLYKQFESKIVSFKIISPESKLYNFIMDGKADIDSEEKFQNFIDELIIELEQFRNYVKSIKNQTLLIKTNALISNHLITNYVNACELKINAQDGVYILSCPDEKFKEEVTLNRADFEVIQNGVSKWLAVLITLSSYDLTGIVEEHSKATLNKTKISTQDIYNNLILNKSFGVLRSKANQQY